MQKLQYRSLKELKKLPGNPRTIKEKDMDTLVKSIKDNPDYFEARPLILSDRTGDLIILAGNQRYEAAKILGLDEVPTYLLENLTPEREREIIIRDNISNGEWDWDVLTNEWDTDLLDLWGLELPADWKTEDDVVEDEAPEVSTEPPVSKLGEIYQLGKHRVMCGDSTDKVNVELLMNGEKADMVFTDPPYGVDYSGRGQNTSNKIENDALSIEDTEAMVSQALSNAYDVCNDGATCFVWHADSKPELRPLFERAFLGAGFKLSATIIWLKKQASMGFQDYRSRHEPCLYGWKGTRKERVTDRTQTTVWESGRDSNYEHPTQKPVFLAGNAINNHDPKIILDLFLGSGSTLIACEQTDRICYGMELDPKYVDVIRKRYAKFISPENHLPDNWQELTPPCK